MVPFRHWSSWASLVARSARVVGWVVLALAIGDRRGSAESRLVSLASGGEPTDYSVVHWTTADGLPQNTITDVVFLARGEVWLATFGGLVRFDGYGFEVLDIAADERLPANRIVSLAAAGPDAFFFLTQQGHLGRVGGGHSELLVPSPSEPVEALKLLVDRDRGFFSKTASGQVWFTNGTSAWQRIKGTSDPRFLLHDFAQDDAGVAWGTWNDRLSPLADPNGGMVLGEETAILTRRHGGGLWLGLQGTVGRWLGGRLDRLRVRPALDRKVQFIEPAGDGTLWVVAGDEVSRLDRQADGAWRRTALPLPAPSPKPIRSLRVDTAGSLWIGTAGGGLYRARRVPIRRISPSFPFEVGALVTDGDGGAYIAGGCRSLFHVPASGALTEILLEGQAIAPLRSPCGVSLAPGPGGRAWARWSRSLFEFGRETRAARVISRALPIDEGPVVANMDGSVWIASRDGGIQRLSGSGGLLRELRVPAPLMSVTPGPDGALWVGGDGVVFRVDESALQRFGPEENVPRGLIRDVLAERDGTTWIGSYGGGLGLLRAGRVTRLTVDQGLPDNSISRILDDGSGRLWISTNRGVAVADKKDLAAVADGRTGRVDPVVLGSERGVAEANFGRPAGFADPNGRLWFGTIDGAVSIDAAAFPFEKAPPEIRIKEVRADDRLLALGPTVRVPPLTVRLQVGLTTPPPPYPEQMRFRFRVEGVDADWVDLGAGRIVTWSPPGPGRYVLLAQARNEDGIWSAAPATVELDVGPAWWQTTSFRLAIALAFALTIVGAVRMRYQGIERRHGERLRALEEQRETEVRVATLRAQLEHVSRAALAGELAASLAHEVRQPIGAIVNNAEAGKRRMAEYLKQPGELERLLGDIVADGLRASEVVEGLRGFLKPVEEHVASLDLSELVIEVLPLIRRDLRDNHVEVDLALTRGLPPVDGVRVQIGQVIVNLVANACEALALKPGARRVSISTALREGRVELVVRDNGPGFAPAVAARAFEAFVTTKPEGLGMGLAICRSIAERHGGRLRADTPPREGVAMTLSLPAAKRGEAGS